MDEIYDKIVGSPEEEGKKQLYKLVFDILVLYGIASELDVLASTASFLEGDEELRTPLLELLLYRDSPKKKRVNTKSRQNTYLLKVAYQPFSTESKDKL